MKQIVSLWAAVGKVFMDVIFSISVNRPWSAVTLNVILQGILRKTSAGNRRGDASLLPTSVPDEVEGGWGCLWPRLGL